MGGGALWIARQHALQRREGFFALLRVEICNRQINQRLFGIRTVTGSGFRLSQGFCVIVLRGMYLAELGVAFGQNGGEFGFRRVKLARVPIHFRRFVMPPDSVLPNLLLKALNGDQQTDEEKKVCE